MCIRDRCRAERCGRGYVRRRSCLQLLPNEEHDHGGGRNGCLLYTSDAADERSSVDLGGRRIIKKKKTDSAVGEGLIDI